MSTFKTRYAALSDITKGDCMYSVCIAMYASMVLHRVCIRVHRVCLIEVVTPLNPLFDLIYVVTVGRGSRGSHQ